MRRRDFFTAVGAAARPPMLQSPPSSAAGKDDPVKRNSRIKQGVTQGVFGRSMNFEDTCREAARLGIKGYDFVDNLADWPTLKKYGLTLSMFRLDYPRWKDGAQGRGVMPPGGFGAPAPATATASTIGTAGVANLAQAPPAGRGPVNPPGWDAIAHTEASGEFMTALHTAIDMAAANDIPNIILLAGTRSADVSDDQGAVNAISFCNKVKAHAEDKGVTLCLEIISSKGGPGSYMFDHFAWGANVLKTVNSPRVKMLMDIYHTQVMDGDVVQKIRDNFNLIGHFHTGGVPGRHELDETQELNWRFIAQTIVDLGYKGFISHEWTPTPGHDAIASLDKVMGIIDV